MPFPISIVHRMLWAQHHFEVMKRHCLRYVRGDCAEFVIERKDASNQQAWGRFRSKRPMPPCIPLFLGDCIQSTHSCLDYLVCQLALIGKEPPNSKHTFPITDSLTQFNESVGRHALKGVPFGAIAIIESLQPYNRMGDPHQSGLWILKTLTNMHKHRDILLTALGAGHAPDDADVFERNGDLYTMSDLVTVDLDAEFGPFPIVDCKVKMNRAITLDIVLNKRLSVGNGCRRLLLPHVGAFVTRFCHSLRDSSCDILPSFWRDNYHSRLSHAFYRLQALRL
jgi:hypothetical protein